MSKFVLKVVSIERSPMYMSMNMYMYIGFHGFVTGFMIIHGLKVCSTWYDQYFFVPVIVSLPRGS